MSEGKTDLRWLRQWAPTFAVLVPLLTATYYLGSELARMDQGQTDLKAGLAQLETRMETRMDAMGARMGAMETRMGAMETRMGGMETRMGTMETRMDTLTARVETLFGEVRAELRENRAAGSRLQDSVANVRERVSILEARQG